MDDPESESKSKWEIDNCCSSKSKSKSKEEEETVVQWILSFGREMVITISSAQLALPPLVVFSSMGLAFSLSFGVFYATYACTANILTFLLPIPPSPPMLLLEHYYPHQHQLGFSDDMISIVETNDDYGPQVHPEGMERLVDYELEERFRGQEGKVEDDHSVGGSASNVAHVHVEGTSIAAFGYVYKDVETPSDAAFGDVQSSSDVAFGYVKDVESASGVALGDVKDVEATKLVTFDEIDSQKPVEVGIKNDEHMVEIHHTVVLSGENNLNSGKAYTLDMAARDAEKEETAIKFDEEVAVESSASKGGIEDAILKTMEEHLIHLNAEAQEIGDEDNNLENFEDFDGAGDDQGYEENVGEFLEGDDDGLHEVWKVKEPFVESWNDKNDSNTQEVDEHAKLKDQGRVGNTVEDDGIVGGSASNVDVGDFRNVETTKPVIPKEIESRKLVELGNKNEEQLSEMHHIVTLCENNLNSSEIYTLDLMAREVIGNANEGERTIKSDEQVVTRSCSSKDGSEEAFLRTKEEHLTHSNAEARVISDERITNNNLVSFEGYQEEEDAGEDLEGEGDGLEEERKWKQPFIESWNNEVNEDAKLRDERRVDMVEDDYDVGSSSSDVVLGDVKDVETTKPVTGKHLESQKLVEVGNENEKHTCELCHRVALSDENNLSSIKREVYTSDMAVREVIRDADKDIRTIKFDETVVTKSSASTDGSEYTALRTIDEHLIHSVEDVPGLGDESLLDERKKNNNLESFEVGNEVKKIVVDDNVDAFACSPPSKPDIDNSNNVKENAGAGADAVNVLARPPSKHDTGSTKIMYKKMPSKKGNLDVDDEKIWEKIHAMKTIVGYNAPSQSTCIGELKALYVFTGVEPPASFEGDSDLDTKLKFLMAIVGVK